MHIQDTDLNMQSVQGTMMSITLMVIAEIFMVLNILEILQGVAYIFTILVATDTLLNNVIKKELTDFIKKRKIKQNKTK